VRIPSGRADCSVRWFSTAHYLLLANIVYKGQRRPAHQGSWVGWRKVAHGSAVGRPAAGNEASEALPSLRSAPGLVRCQWSHDPEALESRHPADSLSPSLDWPTGSVNRLSPLERLARLQEPPSRERKRGQARRYLPWQLNENLTDFT